MEVHRLPPQCSEDVRIDTKLNKFLWSNGVRNATRWTIRVAIDLNQFGSRRFGTKMSRFVNGRLFVRPPTRPTSSHNTQAENSHQAGRWSF